VTPPIGLKAAHGRRRQLDCLAELASRLTSGSRTASPVGVNRTGHVEVIKYTLPGIEALFEVIGGGGLSGRESCRELFHRNVNGE
jgi:hypothetical protein